MGVEPSLRVSHIPHSLLYACTLFQWKFCLLFLSFFFGRLECPWLFAPLVVTLMAPASIPSSLFFFFFYLVKRVPASASCCSPVKVPPWFPVIPWSPVAHSTFFPSVLSLFFPFSYFVFVISCYSMVICSSFHILFLLFSSLIWFSFPSVFFFFFWPGGLLHINNTSWLREC